MRHRPIGIGVQGLADTFIKMRYPFDSEEVKPIINLYKHVEAAFFLHLQLIQLLKQ